MDPLLKRTMMHSIGIANASVIAATFIGIVLVGKVYIGEPNAYILAFEAIFIFTFIGLYCHWAWNDVMNDARKIDRPLPMPEDRDSNRDIKPIGQDKA